MSHTEPKLERWALPNIGMSVYKNGHLSCDGVYVLRELPENGQISYLPGAFGMRQQVQVSKIGLEDRDHTVATHGRGEFPVHVELSTGGAIAGWAVYKEHLPVVSVHVDGVKRFSTVADIVRRDFEFGRGRGVAEFSIDVRQIIETEDFGKSLTVLVNGCIVLWRRRVSSTLFRGLSVDLCEPGMIGGRVDVDDDVPSENLSVCLVARDNYGADPDRRGPLTGIISRSGLKYYEPDLQLRGVSFFIPVPSSASPGAYRMAINEDFLLEDKIFEVMPGPCDWNRSFLNTRSFGAS